jgi:hypothetical protein
MSVVRVSYGPVTSQSVTHRTTVHVALDTSIDLNVTDMWRRDEDYVSGRG